MPVSYVLFCSLIQWIFQSVAESMQLLETNEKSFISICFSLDLLCMKMCDLPLAILVLNLLSRWIYKVCQSFMIFVYVLMFQYHSCSSLDLVFKYWTKTLFVKVFQLRKSEETNDERFGIMWISISHLLREVTYSCLWSLTSDAK